MRDEFAGGGLRVELNLSSASSHIIKYLLYSSRMILRRLLGP